jgi:hypothetical protein
VTGADQDRRLERWAVRIAVVRPFLRVDHVLLITRGAKELCHRRRDETYLAFNPELGHRIRPQGASDDGDGYSV